jgi:predicted transposase YbfD/YdcC
MAVKMKGIEVEGLMEQIRQVKDPRHPRGVRHAFAGIVGIAVCAVFCGARSFRAIAQWGKSLREADLKRFATGRHESPSEPTIRRVLQSIDAEEFDRQIGGWVESQQSVEGKGVAVDGKTLRGSAAGGGAAVHLLSAVVHKEGVVLAQQNVGEKTNEIPCVKPMLEGVRLEGAVVTADALLTQRELATHLVEKKGADYIFTVKGNQPTMEKDIEDLGLEKKTADFRTFDKEHGRYETRQIWVSSELNGYLNFPYVGQVFVIDRKFVYRSGKIKQETNYGVTSLSAEKASAERLMKLIRGHWEIENRLHYVRDVTFDEDRSQVRTKNGARVMASIRNLVISVCRLLGFQFIADALRHFMYRKEESFEVLGI